MFDRLELGGQLGYQRESLSSRFVQGAHHYRLYALCVPNATFWAVAAVAALIPGIGTGTFVFIPAVAFLFSLAQTCRHLTFLSGAHSASGLSTTSSVQFVGSGMKLHPLLVLLSVAEG